MKSRPDYTQFFLASAAKHAREIVLPQLRKRPYVTGGAVVLLLAGCFLAAASGTREKPVSPTDDPSVALGEVSHENPDDFFGSDFDFRAGTAESTPPFEAGGPYFPGGDESDAGNPGPVFSTLSPEVPGVGHSVRPATFESEHSAARSVWLTGTIEEVSN